MAISQAKPLKKYLKESCVETLDQCLVAEKNGADRIELCANLDQDGLTPSRELIQDVFTRLTIPIRVMVRPRGGNFNYSEKEIIQMKHSIDLCKEIGVEGVVFGITDQEEVRLDLNRTKELADYANPLKVTIHKAIDACLDPIKELSNLVELGSVDSVLTSGKARTAEGGIEVLKKMIEGASDKVEVIACGKVTYENIDALDEQLQAKAYHGKLIVKGLTS